MYMAKVTCPWQNYVNGKNKFKKDTRHYKRSRARDNPIKPLRLRGLIKGNLQISEKEIHIHLGISYGLMDFIIKVHL